MIYVHKTILYLQTNITAIYPKELILLQSNISDDIPVVRFRLRYSNPLPPVVKTIVTTFTRHCA